MRDEPGVVRRPALWLRLLCAGVFVLIASRLVSQDQNWTGVASDSTMCALMLLVVISPKSLYSERSAQWNRDHRLLSTLITLSMLGWFVFLFIATW